MVEAPTIERRGFELSPQDGFQEQHQLFGDFIPSPKDMCKYGPKQAQIIAGSLSAYIEKARPEDAASKLQELNRNALIDIWSIDPKSAFSGKRVTPEVITAYEKLEHIKNYYVKIYGLISDKTEQDAQKNEGERAWESVVAEFVSMQGVKDAIGDNGEVYLSTSEEDLRRGIDFWFRADSGKRIAFQVKCSYNSNPPDQIAFMLDKNPENAARQIVDNRALSDYSLLKSQAGRSELSDKIQNMINNCDQLGAMAAMLILPREDKEDKEKTKYFQGDLCLPTPDMIDSLRRSSVAMYLQALA